jgi:hypothetical protein
MPKSPKADRWYNDIYWNRDANPGGPKRGYDANQSLGATAVARIRLSLFKEGGRLAKADDIIKGRELGEKVQEYLTGVTIEEDESMVTKLTLSFENPDYVLTRNNVIAEGDACIVDIGYGTSLFGLNQRFVLIRSHPHFTRGEMPTIQFIGYDGRFAMISPDFLANKRSRELTGGAIARGRRKGSGQSPSVFKDLRDDEVVDRLAYHYGFSIDVDTVPGKKTRVKKKKTSDWEFLRKIAEKRDYTTWVDWDDTNQIYCIHYRPKETRYTKGYVFHHGSPTPQDIKSIEMATDANDSPVGTLLEFHPTLDTTRMITDIEVIHFDRRERYLDTQWLSYTDKELPPPPPDPDNYDFSEVKSYGALLKFKVGGRVIQTWAAKPFKNKSQAKEYAFNLVNKHQADFMTGTGTIVGVQDVRPRQVHRLTGIDIYSGDYYFTQTSHKFIRDGFYECGLVAYRLLDQTLPGLIRRGQITQKWATPLITSQGIKYPGGS